MWKKWYCRERLFVALDFRKGDFGAPLTHLAMRRIIFLVLGLIKKNTTIRDFEKNSCPQRRIKPRFCTTLPSFAMRRLFFGPTLLHVRLIFIYPRNPEVLVWTNAPSLLLDFRSPHPLRFCYIFASPRNPKLLVWTNSPSLLLEFPVTQKTLNS